MDNDEEVVLVELCAEKREGMKMERMEGEMCTDGR